jgi:purine-binding chemotaxis protein CheW
MKKKREDTSATASPALPGAAADPIPGSVEPDGTVNLLAFADWVARDAQRDTAEAVDVESAWVAFRLDAEEYGFPIGSVREILRVEEITRVPQAPPFIRGVTNVRGKILPVVEIRSRLGLSPLVPTPASRVVVLEVGPRTLGLLVDGGVRVVRVRASQVEPPPDEIVSVRTDYVTGVAKREEGLLVLLEPGKTLVVKA